MNELKEKLAKTQRQWTLRQLFLVTTSFAVVYGLMNWFGLFVHVIIWGFFLIAGPIVGIIIGIRRIKESDPIVNGVQAGAIGGAAGYLGASLLVAPAHVGVSVENLSLVGVLGIQLAFAVGGVLGGALGVLRYVLSYATEKR